MKKLLLLVSILVSFVYINAQPKWSTSNDALTWLNTQIKTVRQNDLTFTQSSTINFGNHYYSKISVSSLSAGGKSTDERYEFYLEHIDMNNINPIISGKTLVIELNSINEDRLIKNFKGEVFSGYVNSFKIYFEDLQMARDAIVAIKYIASTNPTSAITFNSDEDAYKWLMNNIKVSDESGKTIQNTIKVLTESSNKFILTAKETDASGATDEKVYEFYLNDFDKNSFQLKTSSSKLGISFATIGQLKPIKFFQNGVQKNYTNKFEIYGSDPLNMIHIVSAFKYLKGGLVAEAPISSPTVKETSVVSTPVSTQKPEVKTFNLETVPTPEYALRPYWLTSNNTLDDLERVDAQLDIKVKGMGYGGAEYFYTAFTPASTVRFDKNNIPVILFRAEPGVDPAEIVSLAVGEVKSDRRRFIQGSMKLAGKARDVGDAYIDLTFVKLKDNLYQIFLPEGIVSGEYAFMPISNSGSPFTTGSKVKIACFAIE